MPVNIRTFQQIVSEQASAAQAAAVRRGAAPPGLDFSIGSVLRALAEATGAVALWLQALCLQVLALTRAATSTGSDLDTWMADFALSRTAAQNAVGIVTFARFTPGIPALVRAGALVKTADAAWAYAVTADIANPAWDAAQNGYTISAGQTSINLPVEATTAGASGNASEGTITLLATASAGVDTVVNALAFAGGADGETDIAFRRRFVAYLASLSRATVSAIGFAIEQVQPGLQWAVIEHEETNGLPSVAHFYVVVDDGTGLPDAGLIADVAEAVEQYRPVGITYAVVGPVLFTANVSMIITTGIGVDHPTVVGAVNAALVAYINQIPLGLGLPYSKLTQIAYAADARVENVTGVLLNGATIDIPASARRAVRAGTIAVS